jgi:hypothetical protein
VLHRVLQQLLHCCVRHRLAGRLVRVQERGQRRSGGGAQVRQEQVQRGIQLALLLRRLWLRRMLMCSLCILPCCCCRAGSRCTAQLPQVLRGSRQRLQQLLGGNTLLLLLRLLVCCGCRSVAAETVVLLLQQCCMRGTQVQGLQQRAHEHGAWRSVLGAAGQRSRRRRVPRQPGVLHHLHHLRQHAVGSQQL